MFALLFTKHPLWNYILKPVILTENLPGRLDVAELLNGSVADKHALTAAQRNIVSEYDTTDEQMIMRIFVKTKMTKMEFQRNFSPTFPNYNAIMESVERTNHRMAEAAMQEQIPVYYKDKESQCVYKSEEIVLPEEPCRLTSVFRMENGILRYFLWVNVDGMECPIPQVESPNEVRVLSNVPGCVLLKRRLYLFKSTSYKKVATFFTKRCIDVPPANLSSYLNTFVKKVLEDEDDVRIEGIKVNYVTDTPRPVLVLTEDMAMNKALGLKFLYGGEKIALDYPKDRIVQISEVGKNFEITVIQRGRETEKRWESRLLERGLVERNHLYYVDDTKTDAPCSVVAFLSEETKFLRDFIVIQDIKEREFTLDPVTYQVEVEDVDQDWFELKGVVKVGEFEIPFGKLRNNIVDGNREYRLPDGRYVILPEEIFTQYSELLRRSPKGERLLMRRSLVGLMNDSFASVQNIRLIMSSMEPLPEGVLATLRSYQELGYSWLVKLYRLNFGGCLSDDMGLGKTLQFLAFLRNVYPRRVADSTTKNKWMYASSEPTLFDQVVDDGVVVQTPHSSQSLPPTLVVMPTSLVFNWESEKNKFTPSLTHYVYAGERRILSSQIGRIFSHYNLIFTTYGILRRDIDYLENCQFECVIFDESQNMKNPSSQIYKAALRLNAKHFFCATGTPIENGMLDLWAQLNLANRDILGSASYFHKYFELPIEKENKERQEQLRSIIKPFVLRRTKKEVAKDLPDKYEQEVYCEMSDAHKSFYVSQKSAVRNTLLAEILRYGKPTEMTVALSSLTFLRQLSNAVELVEEGMDIPSSKVEEIMRRLESLKEEGHKVLVFSSFVKFIELIERELQQRGYGYSKITGATKDRAAQVARFQENEDTFCFLISLKAGGVGLNLTAADYVFLIDPWWNPAAEQQAEDRAYRIGQLRNVFVYRFIMKDTIEEKVLMLQKKKRNLAETFMRNNNPFETLDKSDWEDLLN